MLGCTHIYQVAHRVHTQAKDKCLHTHGGCTPLCTHTLGDTGPAVSSGRCVPAMPNSRFDTRHPQTGLGHKPSCGAADVPGSSAVSLSLLTAQPSPAQRGGSRPALTERLLFLAHSPACPPSSLPPPLSPPPAWKNKSQLLACFQTYTHLSSSPPVLLGSCVGHPRGVPKAQPSVGRVASFAGGMLCTVGTPRSSAPLLPGTAPWRRWGEAAQCPLSPIKVWGTLCRGRTPGACPSSMQSQCFRGLKGRCWCPCPGQEVDGDLLHWHQPIWLHRFCSEHHRRLLPMCC